MGSSVMAFRRTKGIFTDASNPTTDADVIMTAVLLGFTAEHVRQGKRVRFDMDPASLVGKDNEPAKNDEKHKLAVQDWKNFVLVVSRIETAVDDYLKNEHVNEHKEMVFADLAPDYREGAVIMGVYRLADQTAPVTITDPVLSEKGKALYDQIVKPDNPVEFQYIGRGAYTGFVDNKNECVDRKTGEKINNNPVGPRSTARFRTPEEVEGVNLHRWLPSLESPLWADRLRHTPDDYVPWGLIGGDEANKDKDARTDAENSRAEQCKNVTNKADQITCEMEHVYNMKFVGGELTIKDIAAYTHGMIQAIYKAYALGPSCTPYEIAVGAKTTKMSSCLPCTLFMTAVGYPPNSIHLGRGESWAPLYQSYNPNGPEDPHEAAVIRDLNASWREKCDDWLRLGVEVLDNEHIEATHENARKALIDYLQVADKAAQDKGKTVKDQTVAATLVLDALTIHVSETTRAIRTLKLPPTTGA